MSFKYQILKQKDTIKDRRRKRSFTRPIMRPPQTIMDRVDTTNTH